MRNTIIIAGHGKLANNIINRLPEYLNGYQADFWENQSQYKASQLIIVHIGSGRQLPEVMDYCEKHNVPLIQGSTGIITQRKEYGFTLIDAPNLNILMLKFMYMIKECGQLYKNYQISITESHQETKKTLAGTALEIAQYLGVKAKEIKSVRNPAKQKEIYEIPKEFLHLHAFHEICIQDEGTVIHFKTLVKGHESYISGLSKIITVIEKLENKYYHILDLIEMNLIS